MLHFLSGEHTASGNSLPASLLITFAYFCVRIDNSKSKSKRLPPAHVAGQEFIDNATSSIMAIRLCRLCLSGQVLPLLLPCWPCLLHKNVECRAAFVTYYMTVATVRPISILFATPAITHTHTHTGTHNTHSHTHILWPAYGSTWSVAAAAAAATFNFVCNLVS